MSTINAQFTSAVKAVSSYYSSLFPPPQEPSPAIVKYHAGLYHYHRSQLQSKHSKHHRTSSVENPEAAAAAAAAPPKVPPNFEGVDFADTLRLKAAQDAIIREQWIKSMMARLIREELGKCYFREGVNHLEKCKALRDRYFEALKDAKVRGYLFQQQNYIPKDE